MLLTKREVEELQAGASPILLPNTPTAADSSYAGSPVTHLRDGWRSQMWLGERRATIIAITLPNKGAQATVNSVRSFLAPAARRACHLAFGYQTLIKLYETNSLS